MEAYGTHFITCTPHCFGIASSQSLPAMTRILGALRFKGLFFSWFPLIKNLPYPVNVAYQVGVINLVKGR